LIETNDGLVLVDTGFGLGDVANPKRLGRAYRATMRPLLDPEETAARQVVRLGFTTEDVRYIVLTHFDYDHDGGLPDFPKAKVHAFAEEYEAATGPRSRWSPIASGRAAFAYVAEHWAHGPDWVIHHLQGEEWHGFDCVQAITNGLPEVLLVPLRGHSYGHCGVAVHTPDRWLLHCGDAYSCRGEVDIQNPHNTIVLRLGQWITQVDRRTQLYNKARLRALIRDHGSEVLVFCAHDPEEFAQFHDTGRD
jgi:glyoxylase-like metal-dependent hydrolase (beta-lactamase superfamily II)